MIPLKWEKRLQEYLKNREKWMKELFEAGQVWEGRRKFLKMASMAAGFATTQSFVPHSFQLVDVANAATPESQPFTFAYIRLALIRKNT